MADEPYEILPYREVASLKKDIADLKQKIGDSSSKKLTDSMANLSKTMDNMLNLFQTAAEEMKLEEGSISNTHGGLEEINAKLDELLDQNKTLAEGIVAIADMIKEEGYKEEPTKPLNAPTFVPSRPRSPLRSSPPFGSMERAGPIPTPLGPFPPGPAPERPKKGFFK